MAERQLSDARSEGIVLGQSATDKVGFFGATPRIPITAIVSISAAETSAVVWGRLNKLFASLRNLGLLAS